MGTAGPHTKLLNRAAREILSPEGVTQKGRSRTWLDDHGWWIGVIEFQPSSWSKGSYLNVGAHFLWRVQDHVGFDLGYRIDDAGFAEFESEAQFGPEAHRLATRALDELHSLRASLVSPDAAAKALDAAGWEAGWKQYHAGIAHALAGHVDTARERLREMSTLLQPQVTEGIEWARDGEREIEQWIELLDDLTAFNEAVDTAIQQARKALRLKEHPWRAGQ